MCNESLTLIIDSSFNNSWEMSLITILSGSYILMKQRMTFPSWVDFKPSIAIWECQKYEMKPMGQEYTPHTCLKRRKLPIR